MCVIKETVLVYKFGNEFTTNDLQYKFYTGLQYFNDENLPMWERPGIISSVTYPHQHEKNFSARDIR